MEDGTLVLHLDREIIIYPYEGGRQFDSRKQIEKKTKEIASRTGNIDITITRSFKKSVYVAYIVNKGQKGPNNLMLDSFTI
jgi:hypothetical protein